MSSNSKKWFVIHSILISVMAASVCAQAQGKSDAEVNKEATEKTQELLRDPKQREEATKTGVAKDANDVVNQLSGGDPLIAQKIFELSADLMPALVEQGNADPKEMTKSMDLASKNPEAFAKKFTPEQMKKLKEIAEMLKAKGHPKD